MFDWLARSEKFRKLSHGNEPTLFECNYSPTRPLYVHLVACIQFLGKSKTQVCLENKSVFALMSDYSCDTLYFDIKANICKK